ncbi:hypothetical protein CHS0354_028976 [Potamilus streckersoni]|uniref:Uncharacterized protein n=1 Tax=Potamilus streckersoni TaxID=2493646 RepID=A0AAE0W846_9BIVA|nr:hypothetical protein CHS0354_028976 [Potamilus streckersoni]
MSEPTPPSYEESQKYALYPGGAQGSAGGTQETPLGQTPYPQPLQPYPVGGLQGYPAVSQPQPGFQIAVGGQVQPKPHPWYFQPPSSQYQESAGFPQQPGYPSQPYPGVSYGQRYPYTTPNVGYTTATNTVTTYPPTVVTAVPSQVGLAYLQRKKLVFIILTIVIFIVFLIIIFTILF